MTTDSSRGTGGPLAGVTVIEVGQYIAAPYAAKLLGDLGATVIKVESPDGDPMRRWESADGYSPQFGAYNRNKSAVVLDLKSGAGQAALLDLARGADVLMENFRPGVAERLGFGPQALSDVNPRLISCSITGFGPRGPSANRPSYDTVISAIGGMYSQILPADASELRPIGPAFSDLLAGTSAVTSILAALHARSGDGRGQHIEVTMVGALIDFLGEPASTFLQTGTASVPGTRPRRAQAYACVGSDGRAFVIHLSVPEKFWLGLLDVLDRRDLGDDPRFSTREARVRHYDELDALIKRETATEPRDHWLDRLAERDIPHGPLNTMADLFDDPQVAAMDLVTEISDRTGERLRVPRHSARFSRSGRPEYHCAPDLGADNDRLLPRPEDESR